jgi:hypothetical protein
MATKFTTIEVVFERKGSFGEIHQSEKSYTYLSPLPIKEDDLVVVDAAGSPSLARVVAVHKTPAMVNGTKLIMTAVDVDGYMARVKEYNDLFLKAFNRTKKRSRK